MANIRELLNNVKYAIFGKDVRKSIHDAIEECYRSASVEHNNANMEVEFARGTHETLSDRLNNTDEEMGNAIDDINLLYGGKRDKSIKITKNDMDISSNENKLGLNNLSDEVHRAMAGNSEVNPIIPDGSITYEKYAESSVGGDKTNSTVVAKTLLFGTIERCKVPEAKYYDGTSNNSTGKTLAEEFVIDHNCYIEAFFSSNFAVKVGEKYNFIIKTNLFDGTKGSTFYFRRRVNGVGSYSQNATYLGNGIFAILDYVVEESGEHQFVAWNKTGNQITMYEVIVSPGSYPIGDGFMELKKPVENSIGNEHLQENSVKAINVDYSVVVKALINGTTNAIKSGNVHYETPDGGEYTDKTLDDSFDLGIDEYIDVFFNKFEVGSKYNFIIKTNVDEEKFATMCYFTQKINGVILNKKISKYLGNGMFGILDYEVMEYGAHQFVIWNKLSRAVQVKKVYIAKDNIPLGEIKTLDNSIESKHLVKGSVIADKIDDSVIIKSLIKGTNQIIKSGEVHYQSIEGSTYPGKTLDDSFELLNTEYIDVYFNSFKLGDKYNFIIETDIDDVKFAPMCYFRHRVGNVNSNQQAAEYLGDGLYGIIGYELVEEGTHQFVIWNKLRKTVNIKKVYVSKNGYPIGNYQVGQSTLTNGKVVYVSGTGSDSNDGSSMSKALKTFNKALELGATKIYAKSGVYWGQTISASNKDELEIKVVETNTTSSDLEKPRIVLNNSSALDGVTLNDELQLYSVPFVKEESSNYHKVFITKELPIIRPNLRSTSYNAILWEVDTKNIANDIKLVPVLTLEECKNKQGTFFYDGVNLYINPSKGTIDNKQFRYLLNEEGNTITFSKINKLTMEDVEVKFGADKGIYVTGCNDFLFRHCTADHSCYGGGTNITNSNGNLYYCKGIKVCADGFGISGYGDTNFFNCQGHYNYDDGISHHDRCTGSIIGGEWSYNKKGGVAPAHGCEIDVHNVISHNNGYGMYARADVGSVSLGKTVRHINNVYYDNIYGISVKNYHVLSFNCKYENNKTPIEIVESENTSFTQL